jgi:hypothetical protein
MVEYPAHNGFDAGSSPVQTTVYYIFFLLSFSLKQGIV